MPNGLSPPCVLPLPPWGEHLVWRARGAEIWPPIPTKQPYLPPRGFLSAGAFLEMGKAWAIPGKHAVKVVHGACAAQLLPLNLSFPLYFPFLTLGRLCQQSPWSFPVSLPCVGSTQRRATALAVARCVQVGTQYRRWRIQRRFLGWGGEGQTIHTSPSLRCPAKGNRIMLFDLLFEFYLVFC